MPEQSMKKGDAEASTPYLRSHDEDSFTSETKNCNILGTDNGGNEGSSVAVILLHAAQEEVVELFPEHDTEAYPLLQEASNNRQESPVREEVDAGMVEETRTQPGDPIESMLAYVDCPRCGHCTSLGEVMGSQTQEFGWCIQLDATWAILSALDVEYGYMGRTEEGGAHTIDSFDDDETITLSSIETV